MDQPELNKAKATHQRGFGDLESVVEAGIGRNQMSRPCAFKTRTMINSICGNSMPLYDVGIVRAAAHC